MGMTYFKRYRMEIDLRRLADSTRHAPSRIPRAALGARTPSRTMPKRKRPVFRAKSMRTFSPASANRRVAPDSWAEIVNKDGFLAEATWLLRYSDPVDAFEEPCGTIQGIRGHLQYGCIQNIGVTPEHRGQGLARRLLDFALLGFQQVGVNRVGLEVTAKNKPAVRLYQRYGFRKTKTLYKAVEEVWA